MVIGILILVLLGALAVVAYMLAKIAGVGRAGGAMGVTETARGPGFSSDRVLPLILAVVLGVIAIYFWTQATPSNGLYFLSVIVLGIGIMALGGVSRFKGLFQSKPAAADELSSLPYQPADCGIDA